MTPKELNEAAQKYVEGQISVDAFAITLLQQAKKIARELRYLVDVNEDAKDAAAQATYEVLELLDKKPVPEIYPLLRNAVRWAAHKIRRTSRTSLGDGTLIEESSAVLDGEAALNQSVLIKELHAVIATLPEKEQRALELYMAGMSLEFADRKIVSRAIHKIRRKWGL